ncbi:hypothetical protein C8J56DRAFT_1037799 [Mycena floridula]|nr:hypothetical protein C8J56DRAFT_1037799 [Mycena floridula]
MRRSRTRSSISSSFSPPNAKRCLEHKARAEYILRFAPRWLDSLVLKHCRPGSRDYDLFHYLTRYYTQVKIEPLVDHRERGKSHYPSLVWRYGSSRFLKLMSFTKPQFGFRLLSKSSPPISVQMSQTDPPRPSLFAVMFPGGAFLTFTSLLLVPTEHGQNPFQNPRFLDRALEACHDGLRKRCFDRRANDDEVAYCSCLAIKLRTTTATSTATKQSKTLTIPTTVDSTRVVTKTLPGSTVTLAPDPATATVTASKTAITTNTDHTSITQTPTTTITTLTGGAATSYSVYGYNYVYPGRRADCGAPPASMENTYSFKQAPVLLSRSFDAKDHNSHLDSHGLDDEMH